MDPGSSLELDIIQRTCSVPTLERLKHWTPKLVSSEFSIHPPTYPARFISTKETFWSFIPMVLPMRKINRKNFSERKDFGPSFERKLATAATPLSRRF